MSWFSPRCMGVSEAVWSQGPPPPPTCCRGSGPRWPEMLPSGRGCLARVGQGDVEARRGGWMVRRRGLRCYPWHPSRSPVWGPEGGPQLARAPRRHGPVEPRRNLLGDHLDQRCPLPGRRSPPSPLPGPPLRRAPPRRIRPHRSSRSRTGWGAPSTSTSAAAPPSSARPARLRRSRGRPHRGGGTPPSRPTRRRARSTYCAQKGQWSS